MKLVVFPGGGSPTFAPYREVYELIADAAPSYGYSKIDLSLRWPAHRGEDGEFQASLTLDNAMAVVSTKIEEIDQEAEPFDILARSFGTFLAAKCSIDLAPKHLRRIILWGPLPFWRMWIKFVRDITENAAVAFSKGLLVDAGYFPSLVPFEALLGDLRHPAVIATGSNDEYSSSAFLSYLSSLTDDKDNIHYRVVGGAPHEVTSNLPVEVVREYLDALFSPVTKRMAHSDSSR